MKRFYSSVTAILLAVLMIFGTSFNPFISADEPTTVSLVFTGDEADRAGFAQGVITILPGDDAITEGYYLVYYTDGSGVLNGYDEICSIPVTGTRAVFEIPNGNMIPQGAKGIAVFESTTRIKDNAPSLSTAVATAEIPESKQLSLGAPETTFGAVSDVHMNYEAHNRGAYDKWANALEFFSDMGAETIIVSGDMTGDRGENPDLEAQYEKYLEIIGNSSFDGTKIYEGIGNHGNTPADIALMDKYLGGSDEIHPYTNSPYYHVLIKGDAGERDNLYIFMAQEISAAGQSASVDNFSKAQIDWLEGLLNRYSGTSTNIFLIEHSPFLNYGAGDKHGGGYTTLVTFNDSFPQNMRLKNLLTTHKDVIVMSGHTHVSLYDGYNYSDEYNEFARTVHVGSTSQPCGYGGTGVYTRNTDGRYEVSPTYGSEGYIVKVYADYITYTGYNLSTGKIIPAACLIMPTKAYGGAARPASPQPIAPNKAFKGSGSKNDPYIIATAKDFYNFTIGFNASTGATESEMYGYGKYFLQTADIDMSGYEGYCGTEANGNAKSYFAGNYNGNGYTLNVDINGSNQRSVFPYNYGRIYNLKITGSIISEVSAQPVRTNRGGIVNCIFDLNLYANYANGICYTNYNYIYNVYSVGTASGAKQCPDVFAVSSTDFVNMYHYYNTPSGGVINSESGVRSNDISAIATAFNDRESAGYNTIISKFGSDSLQTVCNHNGSLEFNPSPKQDSLPEGQKPFWVTHFGNSTAEGAGVIFTEAYTGAIWWYHVAFSPIEGTDAYEITAISNGLVDGTGKALAIPEGGFVWAANYGNDYPAIYEKDPVNNSWCAGSPNYTNASCNAMLSQALSWSVGDKFLFHGLDLTKKAIPTVTPDLVWYNPAYVCNASYETYVEPVVTIPGDVNADGEVDMFDYLQIKSIYLETMDYTDEEYARADVNEDGSVDMFDYMSVKRMCL